MLELMEQRKINIIQRVFEQQRSSRIVDILRGKTKMDELFVLPDPGFLEPVLEIVFYRLDVVIGGLFDGLDLFGLRQVETIGQPFEIIEFRVRKVAELRQGYPAQGHEILHLDQYPVFDQGIFGKIVGQFFCFILISAVDRRYSS